LNEFFVATVDGSEIWRSPVEGTVAYPSIYQVGLDIAGGWPWDF